MIYYLGIALSAVIVLVLLVLGFRLIFGQPGKVLKSMRGVSRETAKTAGVTPLLHLVGSMMIVCGLFIALITYAAYARQIYLAIISAFLSTTVMVTGTIAAMSMINKKKRD